MGSWGKAYRDNEGKGAEGQKKEKKPRFGEQDALLGVWRVGSGQGMESISTGGDEFWGDPGGGPQQTQALLGLSALCTSGFLIRIWNKYYYSITARKDLVLYFRFSFFMTCLNR